MKARASVRALIAGCVLLAGCSGRDGSRPSGAPSLDLRGQVAGHRWLLAEVDGPDGATQFPATLHGWLEVDRDGGVAGSDGCALFHATSHWSTTTVKLADIAATANGCLSDRGPRDAMRAGVQRVLLAGRPAAVALTPHRLRLSDSRLVLTYVAAGSAASG